MESTKPNISIHKKPRTYNADCTSCGETAFVPFVPIPGKDLYCSDCFTSRKHNGLLSKRLLRGEEKVYDNIFPSIHSRNGLLSVGVGISSQLAGMCAAVVQ